MSSIRNDRIKYRSVSWILRRYFWISAKDRHRVPDLGGFASDSDFLFFYKHAREISWKFSTGHGRAQQKIQVPLGFPMYPHESQRTNIQVLNTQRQILHFPCTWKILRSGPRFTSASSFSIIWGFDRQTLNQSSVLEFKGAKPVDLVGLKKITRRILWTREQLVSRSIVFFLHVQITFIMNNDLQKFILPSNQ